MFQRKSAFTIPEMLVVFSILAILGTIALLSYTTYTSKSRDTARVTDLKNITTVLTLGKTHTLTYPDPTSGVNITLSGATVWTQWVFGKDTIFQTWKIFGELRDPKYGNYYTYSVTQNKREYQIAALFESESWKKELVAFQAPTLPSMQAYAADPFEPSELSPIVWLDATDIDGDGDTLDNPANAATVSSWVNKSSAGSANNIVITTWTLQYSTAGFNSASQSVFIPQNAGVRLPNSAITQGDIFYVVQKRDPFAATDSNGLWLQSSSASNYLIGYSWNFRYALRINSAPNHAAWSPAATSNSTSPYIYWFHTDNTNYSFMDTGNLISQGTTNSVSGHNWAFNAGGAVTNQWADLVVSEILIFNQKLSTENRQKVEWYLAHKWGRTAWLPATHPYKTTAPEASGPVAPPDSTPDAFVFSDVTGASTSTLYTSNTITVWGINTPATISITGWEYSKNASAYTSTASTVNVWDMITVRLTSSSANSTTNSALVNIGGVTESYSVTTLVADTTPDTILFSSITNANLWSTYTSDSVTVSGINVSVPISISGTWALYSISDGIPADATASGGTETASSNNAWNLPADAFDDNTATTGWANNNVLPAWLMVDFWAGNQEKITKYTLYRSSSQAGSWNNNNSSPKNWTFEGSNDGSNWTVLDTETNQTITTNATKREFTFINNLYYRYYRINISAVNHTSQRWVNITEMELVNEGTQIFTSGNSTVSNGAIISIRMPAASTPATTRNALLTVGSGSATFSITTVPADTTPDAFAFTSVSGATLNTAYTSNSITISWINTGTSISISGAGQYRINGGAYTSASGTVQNGDVINILQTSSASNSVTVSSTLNIGWVTAVYNVTTPAPPPDTTPDPFTFPDITGANISTVYTSDSITISGINTGSTLTISGGSAGYDKNGSRNYVSTSTTVQNGDVISLRMTSSATPGAVVNTTLTIGGVSDTFSITTVPPDTTPDPFVFTAVTWWDLNREYISNPVTITGINAPTTIDITWGGWKYNINGGVWRNNAGTVNPWDIITVKLQSLVSWNAKVSTTLTVGWVSAVYDVTSLNPDTTPDTFIFQDIFNASLNSQYISDAITITGINTAVPITIAWGEYRIGTTWAFTWAAGLISNNQVLNVRLTTALWGWIRKTATVTVGGIPVDFNVTTQSYFANQNSQTIVSSNVYVAGNYNGLIVHTTMGTGHYIIAAPSIITYDLSDTNILSIIDNKKFVYNGFQNIPSSYAGNGLSMSGGFDFAPSAEVLFEGERKDLWSYSGLKQIHEGIRSNYMNFPAYYNISRYLDDYTLWYLEDIIGGVIGINPIKPYYCSDILQSKLVYNVAPDAFISASPSAFNSYGTGWIANGKKETVGDLDYEYHSQDGNASIFFEWPTAQKIGYIKIYNRTGCCSERLSGASIKLYNELWEVIYTHPLWDTTGDYVIDVDLEGIGAMQYAKMLSLETVWGNQLNLREVEIFLWGKAVDGIYKVDKDWVGWQNPYNVYCDMTTDGGGWTRIGEDFIENGNFQNQNHIAQHTFSGYTDVNDNLIVTSSIMAPPSSLPGAFVLQHNGGVNDSYQLFFPDIPGEYYAQEIRLSLWVKGTSSSLFHNMINYEASQSTTQPAYSVIEEVDGWQHQIVRIPLTGLVKDFTWNIGKWVAGPFYFTGVKMEVYYR